MKDASVTSRPGSLAVLMSLALSTSLGAASLGCGGPSTAELIGRQPWHVTVYYTAVESFHDERFVSVEGCTVRECANGDEPLGSYPQDFVDAVREEGAGRLTSGQHAGKYLNWSYDIGYWLDDAPRDAHGRPLRPFHSAAADGLPDGTKLRMRDCGVLDSGEAAPAEACRQLRDGKWEILDQFTPGLGGPQHIDLYIGEETGPGFTTTGALYVSLHGAVFAAED